MALEHAVAILAPAACHAVGHRHGADDLGVAHVRLGEAVVARRRGIGLGERRLDQPFVDERQGDQNDRAGEGKAAQQRVQQENDEDVERRPRHVEDGVDASAGDEAAEGIEVANLAAGPGAGVPLSIITVRMQGEIR